MISSYFGDARASGMMGNTAELLFENPDILAFSDITYDKNGAERFMDTIFTNIDAKGSEGSDRRKLGLICSSRHWKLRQDLQGKCSVTVD